jgi:hypothetical protein
VTINVSMYCEGAPTASEIVGIFACPAALNLAASATNSQAIAGTDSTGTATWTLEKNGSSIGTIVFSASTAAGVFTGISSTNFVAGDLIQLIAPSSPDATLANVAFTLVLT